MRTSLNPALAILAVASLATGAAAEEPAPLKEAKLIIEYNATDDDTGFQGFIDSEGWQTLTVTGPAGEVLRIEGLGALGSHGLTELFFETVEPAADDMPIADVLDVLPEGAYRIEGEAFEAGENMGRTVAVAHLSHVIPAGPVLASPTPGAVVQADRLLVDWEPVTSSTAGDPVEIIAYQLIVERAGDPHPAMIGKFGLSLYLPASVTEIELPGGFLEPAAAYNWEVLAIAANGNQTLASSAFRTE